MSSEFWVTGSLLPFLSDSTPPLKLLLSFLFTFSTRLQLIHYVLQQLISSGIFIQSMERKKKITQIKELVHGDRKI